MAGHASHQADRAKTFLRDRILVAAAANDTALSVAEIAMLTYSEPDATPEQHEIAQEVASQIGEDAYERKIEKLIRSAHQHDVANGLASEWKASLRALRGEDLYVLIMAERAGVFKGGDPAWYGLLSFDMVCFAALGAAGFAFFMTRIGSNVIPSDAFRVVLFVVWIGALWALGEWSRRRIGRR